VNPGDTPEMTFELFSLPAFDDGQVPIRETGKTIKSQKLRVPHDAVLIAKLNPRIPRVWRPDDSVLQNPVASTEWVVLRPVEDGTADLLHALVSSENFANRLATLTTGTTGSHQRVKPQDVVAMKVPWPKDSAEVTTFIRPLYDLSRSNSRQSQALIVLRDTMLPGLIAGELRTEAVDELVEAAR
jgi:type I restriction enzyme S subunit